MRRIHPACLVIPVVALACAGNPGRQTLAGLHRVRPDTSEVQVENGLDQAMQGYRAFLEQAPASALTPEAMRRLADLQLEKKFGIRGGDTSETPQVSAGAPDAEPALEGPVREEVAWAGPERAIELYDRILSAYPDYPHNDQVLYQKARAYDELGETDQAIAVIDDMIARYPQSSYIDEVQFRRGEYFFTRRKYGDAEVAYAAAVDVGSQSPYYELALYKLGWALYKQEMHEEALRRYMALLDYKVETGYDFDQTADEGEEQRIADTYRVISLSFSSLGGAGAVGQYFAANGHRGYEDRIYNRLGAFYLEKLRYHDAAETFAAFVDLHPFHRSAPGFGMRIAETYEAGGFPRLVLEAKKDFASRYGLGAEYWRHVTVDDAPEVVDYLKQDLNDLATHFHAVYQDEKHADERPASFREAERWYRAYLDSFAADPEAPGVDYRLADLLLEHEDFDQAAREYERTAYEYAPHERAAAAGYAAIYARREFERRAEGEAREAARRDAVESTLRFVEAFPEDEHAAVVLGAAVGDLYRMKDFERAIARGRQLIEHYPDADPAVVRATFAAVAHSYFDTARYEDAEGAYARVLELTPADDESRAAVTENLAAAIYEQGERANAAQDYRRAADHFLRIRDLAPESKIRAAAEYDAGAALIRLEAWEEAAAVLEAFRKAYPDHELAHDATRQIASVYRSAGDLVRAGEEYERVAGESDLPDERREALLLAGDLYEEAKEPARAIAVYRSYVDAFPEPLDAAAETRFALAGLYAQTGDEAQRKEQLRRIVTIDREAGASGGDVVRGFAAKSALALAVESYERFDAVKLVQPFEANLEEKKRRMNQALEAFEALVDYEVGEATAGATYYIAEIYYEFSRALLDSERPSDLGGGERQQYELVLEEEAFPFEEQAIEVHEKNLELMSTGVYNSWIEKSLAKLAALVPGRYAKFEESSGLIASIDEYTYRVPSDAAGSDGAGESEEVPATPAALGSVAPASTGAEAG